MLAPVENATMVKKRTVAKQQYQSQVRTVLSSNSKHHPIEYHWAQQSHQSTFLQVNTTKRVNVMVCFGCFTGCHSCLQSNKDPPRSSSSTNCGRHTTPLNLAFNDATASDNKQSEQNERLKKIDGRCANLMKRVRRTPNAAGTLFHCFRTIERHSFERESTTKPTTVVLPLSTLRNEED